ncbi:MAG: DUF2846 domain-containing protein [Mariprofundaceae bacterium]|nr:DUF2846 domain-containing protein [Mariprofundaceae bacterium]
MILRGLWIAIVLAMLGGCGAGGAKFSGLEQIADNSAQVYIYRPSSFIQSANYPDLALDGQEIGQLKNGGYLRFTVPAGEHNLSVTGNVMMWIHRDRNVPLKLEAGKTYFYKLTVTLNNSSTGGVNIGFGQSHGYGFYQIKDEKEALAV